MLKQLRELGVTNNHNISQYCEGKDHAASLHEHDLHAHGAIPLRAALCSRTPGLRTPPVLR